MPAGCASACVVMMAVASLALAPAQGAQAAQAAAQDAKTTPRARTAQAAPPAPAARATPGGTFEAEHALGERALKRGRIAEAIPHLERADALDPTHAVNGYDLATAYLRLHRLAQARTLVQRLLTQRPGDAELENLLGDVEQASGELTAAAEAYQRAAQRDEREEHLFDFGDSLLHLGAAEEAERIFEYGVGRHPDSARLWVGFGVARYDRGKYDDAVRALCRASDLNPGDPRPHDFLGEMYGVAPAMTDEISSRLSRFVARNPTNARGQYYYALNLWKGRMDGGTRDVAAIERRLRAAVRLDPSLAPAHLQLGVLLADQARDADAIVHLRRAAALDPALAEAHYRLAQLYRRMGQDALASQSMARFQRVKGAADAPRR